jgi:hypothetical protein
MPVIGSWLSWRDPCNGQSHQHSASFQDTTPCRWVQTAERRMVRPPERAVWSVWLLMLAGLRRVGNAPNTAPNRRR